jgi:peptide/nickel transport system ATP-binding protein
VPLLQVNKLDVAYEVGARPVQVVDAASFTVDRSHAVGIVGESGCGKSTLAFALMRLLPRNGRVTGGQIVFDGRALLELTDSEMRAVRWKRISMIFQAAMNSLNPVMRVGDIIREALYTHENVSRDEARRRTVELFEMVGLSEKNLKNYPHELSGGMKQRAVIAMSLICRPELIIADEPTTALDVVVQGQILRRLKALAHELGISLVVISHDLGVIAEVCDSVAVMYAGQIVEHGAVTTIFKKPRHPYTIALMSSIPSLVGPLAELMSLPGSPPNLMEPPRACRFAPRCPVAEPLCAEQAPPRVQVSPGHLSLCHFANDQKIAVLQNQASL